MRTNFRFIARAIDWPSEVLPTPGRADETEDRSLQIPLELPDREVLDDALLDLVEIVVILVEDATRFDRIEPILGALLPRARRAASPGRCGSSGTRVTPASSAPAARPREWPPWRHVRAASLRRTRLRSSCDSPSPSPSSVWIALSCCRSTYCRCASVISFSARDSICPFSSSTSISRDSATRHRVELDDDAVLFEQLLLVLRPSCREGWRAGRRSAADRRSWRRAP